MDYNRTDIESLVRKILLEELAGKGSAKRVSKAGVASISLPSLDVRPEDRLDTGNPDHQVYTRDLLTLEEDYDEVDYVIEGRLDVISGDEVMSAGPGEIIFIPKGSDIQFSVKDKARFIYVTYPADWQG